MAQRILLPTTTITTAVAGVVGPTISVPKHTEAIFEGIFVYGSGGTTAKVWVQTSVDGGTTWFDIANLAFLLASLKSVNKVTSLTAVAANYPPTDATLADSTIKDGLLGNLYRTKMTTTGTYAGATNVTVYAYTR